MISIILVALGAISNAIMDKTTHHYDRSIFKKYNRKFWDPSVSWENKYEDLKTLKRKTIKLW